MNCNHILQDKSIIIFNEIKRIETILISTQHSNEVTQEQIKKEIIEKVINTVIDKNMLDENTKIYVNPTGRFVIGGPLGDTGLTGRKIICDTYGGVGRHGGGAFSGKDASKVDRSGAYFARYIAKNIIAANLAHECDVALSYAIGVPTPTSVDVNTFGTGIFEDEKIAEAVKKVFASKSQAILDLNFKAVPQCSEG